jgi:hypothetical protein
MKGSNRLAGPGEQHSRIARLRPGSTASCESYWKSGIFSNPDGQRGSGVILGYLLLNGGKRQPYKHTMRAMGEVDRKDPPRTIAAEELQIMLDTNQAFCSWDASNSMVSELMARWPFLFSHPLMGTNKSPHNRHPERSLIQELSDVSNGIYNSRCHGRSYKERCVNPAMQMTPLPVNEFCVDLN